MSTRPSEDLKEVADSLAKLLASEKIDRKIVQDLMGQLGYSSSVHQSGQQRTTAKFVPGGNIGIYSPEIEEGITHYRRNPAFRERWFMFADVPVIPPKGLRKRIVLLGESVARGFLLDPVYTPAGVLNILLNNDLYEEDGFEVVDLAETSIEMEGLKLRYKECLALKPDLVIFFAGNNWRPNMEINMTRDQGYLKKIIAGIKQDNGIASLKTVMEESFAALIDDFLSTIQELAVGNMTRLVFVIPEFNLLDWRSSPGERSITKLDRDGILQWTSARQEAEDALAKCDFETAEIWAEKMIDLDPTHPLGFEIIADCKMSRGEYAAARDNLELARDTALFCRTNSKPRTYKVIRETILARAAQYDIQVVDLPALFSTHLNGKVPGRNLFLDYCHLTVEGIQVAMQAVAEKVFEIFGKEKVSGQVRPGSIEPESSTQSAANFFAAIHNGHWGQSYEILLYHCKRSLQHSTQMAENMIRYCDMVCRRTDNVLCRSFEVLVSGVMHDRYMSTLKHPKNLKNMEIDLVNAMVTALKDKSIDLATYVNDLRASEHGVTNRKVNLLRPFYHNTCYDEYQGTKTAFFQARDRQSRYFLVDKKDCAVTLELTLRIPELTGQTGTVVILVNEMVICDIEVSEKWSDHKVFIPGNVFITGVNVITVQWPVPVNVNRNSPLLTARRSSFDIYSMLDAVYYVFGEIIRFNAVTK